MDVMSTVHHLTYAHIGDEPLEELQGLCRGCHEYLSAETEIDPADRVMWTLGFVRLSSLVTADALERAIQRSARIFAPLNAAPYLDELVEFFRDAVERARN